MLQPETSLSCLVSKLNVTETFPITVGYFNKGKVQSSLSNSRATHGYVRKEYDFDQNSTFNFPRKNQDKQKKKTWEK